jgi:hypothetical protein
MWVVTFWLTAQEVHLETFGVDRCLVLQILALKRGV